MVTAASIPAIIHFTQESSLPMSSLSGVLDCTRTDSQLKVCQSRTVQVFSERKGQRPGFGLGSTSNDYTNVTSNLASQYFSSNFLPREMKIADQVIYKEP